MLAMLARSADSLYDLTMRSPQSAGGRARARVLGPGRRSEIARRAAQARWSSDPRTTLSMSVLRELADRLRRAASGKATVYLFGSYARGEATSASDVDLLVVENGLGDWVGETVRLRRVARAFLDKEIDIVVVGDADFRKWRGTYGTVQHVASREGIRIAG
jgi:predicted nucleotidyltransferase